MTTWPDLQKLVKMTHGKELVSPTPPPEESGFFLSGDGGFSQKKAGLKPKFPTAKFMFRMLGN